MKKITVVIVNWNGLENLKIVIPSLKAQTFKDFDIIISDNGSTDGSIEWLKKNKIKVIENGKNLGFPAGANRGMRTAKTKYIAVLNDDMYVDKNCLKNLYDFAEKHPDAGAAQVLLVNFNGDRIESTGLIVTHGSFIATNSRGEKFTKSATRMEPREILGVGGGCGIFRTELVRKLGFFDENFSPGYYEDADISFRIRKAGYKCYLVPSAVIYHKHGNTINKIGSPFRLAYHRNRYLFLKKHGTPEMWAKTLLWLPIVTAFFTFRKPEFQHHRETYRFFSSIVKERLLNKKGR